VAARKTLPDPATAEGRPPLLRGLGELDALRVRAVSPAALPSDPGCLTISVALCLSTACIAEGAKVSEVAEKALGRPAVAGAIPTHTIRRPGWAGQASPPPSERTGPLTAQVAQKSATSGINHDATSTTILPVAWRSMTARMALAASCNGWTADTGGLMAPD
jgi:hypothetical protein